MHRDAVLQLPQGAVNLGSSPACEIQGLYIPGRVFSVQAHPEFNGIIMGDILDFRHRCGIIDDTLFDNANRRANNKHDGDLVGEAIWRFLLDKNKSMNEVDL